MGTIRRATPQQLALIEEYLSSPGFSSPSLEREAIAAIQGEMYGLRSFIEGVAKAIYELPGYEHMAGNPVDVIRSMAQISESRRIALYAAIEGKGSKDPAYKVEKIAGDAMVVLRSVFPTGQADEMNLCLFSTSGTHGSSTTIEDLEGAGGELTVMILKPRLCRVDYGIALVTPVDIPFLKSLRDSSRVAMLRIG